MAIASLHWVWQLIWTERLSAARPEQHVPLPMKIEVGHLPDYRWRTLGFVPVGRSDETERSR